MDGSLFAVVHGDYDNDIGLIDTATGRTLRVLTGFGYIGWGTEMYGHRSGSVTEPRPDPDGAVPWKMFS